MRECVTRALELRDVVPKHRAGKSYPFAAVSDASVHGRVHDAGQFAVLFDCFATPTEDMGVPGRSVKGSV